MRSLNAATRWILLSCLTAAGLALTGWAAGGLLLAQGRGAPPPPPINVSTNPLLQGFSFRSIGPATMMGRLDVIVGADQDPMTMYIGFATGGLWKSSDGGIHWKSLFDEMPNESIGDIAIAPSDKNVVYVGTGEPNNRQSSTIGDGMWGSTDGGKTWTHLGLDATQSIGRVAVDPTNPKVVYVAAVGHLFGPNPDRGLYKTEDGGKTWTKSKYIDPNTGFTDVAIDPSHPQTVYAASYERRRTWWGFNGGGVNSGLWKTTDGGAQWTRLDGPGWPKPKDGLYGRIAIAIYAGKPSTLYAQVEAGASGGTGAGTAADGGPLRPGRGGGGGGAESGNLGPTAGAPAGGRAGAQGADAAGGRAGRGPAAPPDPNASGVFRSDDGGQTWTFMSQEDQRPVYFSQIRVDPTNDLKLLVGGNPGRMSLDGGKTWTNLTGSHTDYHALWINPKDPRIVAVGHDGGLDISGDGGVTFGYHNDIAVGQFYQVSADMRRPYYVCGGLQDNNAWCGPSALRSNTGPTNTDWFTVAGGDGFYTRQDPTDWAIVYAESQDGDMARLDLRTGTQKSIKPSAGPAGRGTAEAGRGAEASPTTPPATLPGGTPTAPPTGGPAAGPAVGGGGRGAVANVLNLPPGVAPFRFYWNAPMEISPENPSVIYMAAQYFFKSTDRGDTWTMNPHDLTKNIGRWDPAMSIMGVAGNAPMVEKHDGYSASSLITQVRESPSRPGVIWVGTDDGNLQVSTDDGDNFTNVIGNIHGAPRGDVQIERIEPSHFDPATAYVALDAHRNADDWHPYLYKTTDYGKSWISVVGNLPEEGNIEGLREDLENPNLLFVGTEFGLFVTLDGGRNWSPFMTDMPNVRVDDILIHPRDRDLIIGTHGRSIWIADDITPLEQMNQIGAKDLFLFDPRPAVQWKNDPESQRNVFQGMFRGENPQGGTAISVWSKSDLGEGKVDFLLNDKVVSTMNMPVKAGMNRMQWNMREPAPPQPAGRGGRGGGGAGRGRGPATVPFVASGRGGGGFGGGGGALVAPGSYIVRLTVGGQTLESSVEVLDDIWMRPQ